LNRTKALDKLKELEKVLQRQNEEDRALIQDDNTSPSKREAVEATVAERNKEITHLQTQIEERGALPLRDRIKEFSKNMASL